MSETKKALPTFAESVKISWRKELQTKNPRRILRLAFFIVYYGAIHYLYVVPMTALIRLLGLKKR
jgi:hypothetical protein